MLRNTIRPSSDTLRKQADALVTSLRARIGNVIPKSDLQNVINTLRRRYRVGRFRARKAVESALKKR